MLFQTRPYLSLLSAIGSGTLASLAIFTPPSFAGRRTGQVASRVSRRTKVSSQILFDDFNYSNYRQLAKHGWIIRSAAGWPGVPGAIWGNKGVSFPADQDQRGRFGHLIHFIEAVQALAVTVACDAEQQVVVAASVLTPESQESKEQHENGDCDGDSLNPGLEATQNFMVQVRHEL